MSEAMNRVLRNGTYDMIWCPLCGAFSAGPWPVAMIEMHNCAVSMSLTKGHDNE